MRTTFRVIGWVIAAAVAIQGAVMVFAIAGLFNYVDGGGVIDRSSGLGSFPEAMGVSIHILLANYVFPVLGLAALVVALFIRRAPAIWTGAGLLVLILLEWYLGVAGYTAPFAGFLHGVNALVIFALALLAGLGRMTRVPDAAHRASATV